MKESTAVSPRIASVTWGRMKVEGLGWGKDFKLYPGGGREWDWAETGTQHVPGIQPSDVQELLDHGARVVVLSRGMLRRLQVCPQTLKLLKGNRFNGLITPYRPMTMESAAGKNPVTHVGKLYNVAANRIATAIVAEIKVVSEVGCYLASQIGRPVDQPQAVEVRTLAGEETLSAEIKNRIEEIVHDQLSRLNRIWEESVQCQSSLDRICLSEFVLLCFRSLSDAD